MCEKLELSLERAYMKHRTRQAILGSSIHPVDHSAIAEVTASDCTDQSSSGGYNQACTSVHNGKE